MLRQRVVLLFIVALSACGGSAQRAPTVAAGQGTSQPTPSTTLPQTPLPDSAASATTILAPLVASATTTAALGWEARAPMPTARTEVAAAELGGRLFVVGGFAADGSTLATVEVYDPVTDTWTTAAPLPAGRNHLGLAALGGQLYAVGGYAGALNASTLTADVWAYDGQSTSWTTVALLPSPRAAHALVAHAGRLYAVGGVGPDAQTTLAYDPAADRWTPLASLPTPREHLAAAALDGRLYAVAGRVGSRNLDTLEVYSIAEDRWTTGPPLPTPRSGLAAVALAGNIYVTGGEALDGSGVTFSQLEVYAPTTGAWRVAEAMPTARHGLGGAVYNGSLYIIGGGPVAGLTVSAATERYTPTP